METYLCLPTVKHQRCLFTSCFCSVCSLVCYVSLCHHQILDSIFLSTCFYFNQDRFCGTFWNWLIVSLIWA